MLYICVKMTLTCQEQCPGCCELTPWSFSLSNLMRNVLWSTICARITISNALTCWAIQVAESRVKCPGSLASIVGPQRFWHMCYYKEIPSWQRSIAEVQKGCWFVRLTSVLLHSKGWCINVIDNAHKSKYKHMLLDHWGERKQRSSNLNEQISLLLHEQLGLTHFDLAMVHHFTTRMVSSRCTSDYFWSSLSRRGNMLLAKLVNVYCYWWTKSKYRRRVERMFIMYHAWKKKMTQRALLGWSPAISM